MLMTNKSRLTSKAQLCIQRSFFIIYLPLIEYLFFLLQNCHSVKSILEKQRNILVYEFADFSFSWQKDENKENNAKPLRPLVHKKILLK